MAQHNSLMLVVHARDAKYSGKVNTSNFSKVYIRSDQFHTWTQVRGEARKLGCTAIATTQFPFFFTQLEGTADANCGSLLERDGLQVLLIPELARTWKEPHMVWYIDRLLRKLTHPKEFVQPTPFFYTEVTSAHTPAWLAIANKAFLCAVDIETVRGEEGLDQQLITSIAYTLATLRPDGSIATNTCAIDFLKDWQGALHFMREMNATAVPKVMQNGQYDASYFLRFGAPMRNWFYDTYNLQHCLYSELPADIAYMAQLYCLKVRYWKQMAGYNRLEYNGRDAHVTLWVWLGQLRHILQGKHQYAIRNYLQEFPLVFPSLHCGLEGILVDAAERERLMAIEQEKKATALGRLQYVLGVPKFNPSSPKQVGILLEIMGHSSEDGTDKKAMQKFAERHPLNLLLVELTQAYRKASKAISTYYEFPLMSGRLLYQLDPAGTETGRMASKASNFWVGTQIQNIPAYAKSQFIPDKGWLFGSVDGSQAESRCTAYISQDQNLMHTVETSPDFHCTNASLFFGIPFSQLYQQECVLEDGSVLEARVLRKDIRTTAKRVNHGANYNMGAFTLWETMGTKDVFKAARLLGLPRYFGAMEICRHLLGCFSNAYPDIKGRWYGEVISEVLATGKLVGATGWTRRTFLRPSPHNKPALNALVAHPPQSLSVMIVNKVFYKAWRMQMTTHTGRLRIKAQIHDEVFFQYKEGHEAIAEEIGKVYREETVQVHGRTMRIPNEPKYGAANWALLKE